MHNFQENYDKILQVLNSIEPKNSFLIQIRKPKLSDKELISINLTSEYMGIDSESQLFRILPALLAVKIERSVYNRRKRKLFYAQEQIRKKLTYHFHEFEDYFIVDTMPLEVCKLSRDSRSNTKIVLNCRIIFVYLKMGRLTDLLVTETEDELKKVCSRQNSLNAEKRVKSLLYIKQKKFKTRKEVSDFLGVHIRTLERWLNKYRLGGIEKMLHNKPSNIGSKIITSEIHKGLEDRVNSSDNPFLGYWDAEQWVNDTMVLM